MARAGPGNYAFGIHPRSIHAARLRYARNTRRSLSCCAAPVRFTAGPDSRKDGFVTVREQFGSGLNGCSARRYLTKVFFIDDKTAADGISFTVDGFIAVMGLP